MKLLIIFSLTFVLAGCGNSQPQPRITDITVEVTGDEFNWYFRYPGLDGQLGTDDDQFSIQNLYLPDHARVTLNLHSKDYVYNLSIPSIGKKEIAVPDLNFSLQFATPDEITWVLKGDQFCGFSHETLIGKIFIRDQSENRFYNW